MVGGEGGGMGALVLGVRGIRVICGSVQHTSCPLRPGLLARFKYFERHVIRIVTCRYGRLLTVSL